jgi:DNA-binding IclR family transcriptional regulator
MPDQISESQASTATIEEDSRRGIQSVEIGLRFIEALAAADGPMSLKALSIATGLRPSSCHRYLTSFVRARFVVREATAGRYDLGPRVLHAGLRALARTEPMAVALNACARLVAATGHTVQLAIWSDRGPVVVDWRHGPKRVYTNFSVGSTLPVLASATGRAFVAYLPSVVTEPLVREEGRSRADADKVAREVREDGHAAVSGDVIPGLSAAAAPILDSRGNAAAVVTLLGLADGFSAETIKSLGEIARLASEDLGWSG